MYNKGADQTAQMHRLVFAFVVRKSGRQVFSREGPNIKSWTIDGINTVNSDIFARILFSRIALKKYLRR